MTKEEIKICNQMDGKSIDEIAVNIIEHRDRKELDEILSKADELTDDEKFYMECQNQNRNHTLNIRFNDAEWKYIEKQSKLLFMKKSAYVRECVTARSCVILDRDETNELIRQIKGIAANVNHISYRMNVTGRLYEEDIKDLKNEVNKVWRLLTYILSGVQQVKQLDILLTQLRPTTVSILNLLCARETQNKLPDNSENLKSVSEQEEVPF